MWNFFLPAFINHFTKPSLLIFAITNIVYLCQPTLSHILGRREHTHLIASIWNVRRRQRGVCLMTHRTPRIRTVRLHILEFMYVCVHTYTHSCLHETSHLFALLSTTICCCCRCLNVYICCCCCCCSWGVRKKVRGKRRRRRRRRFIANEIQWTDADRNKIPKTT